MSLDIITMAASMGAESSGGGGGGESKIDSVKVNGEALPVAPDKSVNIDLQKYSLIADTGCELSLAIDPTTYIMTLELKNAMGEVLSSKTIDFPLESMVVGASYNKATKELTLSLQNGSTLEPIDISDIVRGLVPDDRTIAGLDLKDDITAEELKAALGIDDDYLPLAGGTMEGNIDMNGHHIRSNNIDIDMVDSDDLEIGIREEESPKEWRTVIELLHNDLKLKSKKGRILLDALREIEFHSLLESFLDLGEDVELRSKDAIHIRGFGDRNLIKMAYNNTEDPDRIEILIGDAGIGTLLISKEGIVTKGFKSRNGIRIETSEEDNGIQIINNSSNNLEIVSKGTVKISSYNQKMYLIGDEIRLLPGTTNSAGAPNPEKYVKTGNIQGIKDADGNKPKISNFAEYSGDKVNVKEVNAENIKGNINQIIINGDFNNTIVPGLYSMVDTDKNSPKNTEESYSLIVLQSSSSTNDYIQQIAFDEKNDYNIWYRNRYAGAWNEWKRLALEDVLPPYNKETVLFDDIYANNSVIQTSDANEKDNIKLITEEQAKALLNGILPKTYTMNSGTSGRTHWGIISQDIEKLLQELGWSDMDFAGFIKSSKVRIITEDENGNPLDKPIEEVIPGEYTYSLRYSEFIALIIRVVQAHEDEINSLKKTVQNQNERIEALEKMVKQLLSA